MRTPSMSAAFSNRPSILAEAISAFRDVQLLVGLFQFSGQGFARAGASFRLLAFRATAVLASCSVRSSSRFSTP